MPPKKKRGGAGARGRGGRGRGTKRGAAPAINLDVSSPTAVISPVFEQNETSSSNSSVLEEPAQPETRIKLETKIHKKFGIKYHVPDEVVIPKTVSPIVEDVSSSILIAVPEEVHVVSVPMATMAEIHEEMSEPSDHSDKSEEIITSISTELERVEAIAVSVIQENVLENEIIQQMHQLEVAEEATMTDDMENVEMQEVEEIHEVDFESGVMLEYITQDDEDEVLLTSEVEAESQSEAEEVYYVLEEDSQDAMVSEHTDTPAKCNEVSEIPIENDGPAKSPESMEVADIITPETTVEIVDKAKDKKKDDKAKTMDKPCRKSKRISLRGQYAEEKVEVLPFEPCEDIKVEPEEEQAIPDSTLLPDAPEKIEDFTIKAEETPMEASNMLIEDVKVPIEENHIVINKTETEAEAPEAKEGKKNKRQPGEKKKQSPRVKKTKDLKEKTPKEEKKKCRKQVTFKVQSTKGKKTKDKVDSEKSQNEEDTNIRRSSRIKTISTQKVRSRGKGLVKKDDVLEVPSTPGTPDDKNIFVAPTSTTDVEHKPVKVKSRWRRSSELEMRDTVKAPVSESSVSDLDPDKKKHDAGEVERRLKQFLHLKENVYLTERISCKEAKKMVCDCFLTEEEIGHGEYGCGDDCLNRLLMIECGNLCTVGERCTNKRFQKMQCATVEAFATEKKGLGIRAAINIPSGDFILEYVGEVLDAERFEQRAGEYSMDKNQHYYFMALRADAIIDATMKGNISRFINHSCEPNAETQKWTVNGELRIGFFSKRTILAGEEITFDYQFQRYGKEAQKCFCEAENCRGWLGEEPDSDDESDDDEDDDDEEEEEEEEEEKEGVKEEKEEVPGEEETEKVKPVVKKVKEKKEKPPKKERKPRQLKPRRKQRMDRFEDLGLDEEIESLQTTGLKNQAQTLKLSRLMVRAKEPVQRTKLLKLLKKGELPCRRLFLDYHGLRLIHGWMTDAQHLAQMESLRLEILQTLAMLPIPNKTMLQDSKVLPTVEKWSKEVQTLESPVDSDSNSPKMDVESATTPTTESEVKSDMIEVSMNRDTESSQEDNKEKTKELKQTVAPPVLIDEEEIRKSNGMEPLYVKVIPDYTVESIRDELLIIFDDDFVPLEMPIPKPKPAEPEQPKYDVLVEIMALALKLLEEWSSLKEVFRIPKKERIEQMKEHEREADRRYKALSVEQETERRRDRYRGFQRPSRIEVTDRLNKDRDRDRDRDRERDRERDRLKGDRYSALQPVGITKMSKQERRELFARQAEEEERRRKQELWSKQNWMMVGQDPRMQGYESRNMQLMWNPQIGSYQNVITDPNIPPGFSYPPPHAIQPGMLPPAVAPPNMPPANMGTMPPMPNIPPRPVVPYQEDFDDPSKVQFMGPIPPEAKLPAKWKTAKDKYNRPYYYHVKLRISQWEPPEYIEAQEEQEEEDSESTSSSDTSSLTSSSSSEDSESEDDTKLMIDIKNKFIKMEAEKQALLARVDEDTQPTIATEDVAAVPALSDSFLPADDMNISDISVMTAMIDRSMAEEAGSPVEGQLAEEDPPTKKRRLGLVQEHIISPRTEEDRLQFREDVKKYKLNKEMVRKQKENTLQQTKKHLKPSESPVPATPSATTSLTASTPSPIIDKQKVQKKKVSSRSKLREMEANTNSEDSKKIKENFRTAMATVMVNILNPYRKPDCKEGRIIATEDFKHLARKLTHFVMLKELKHCDRIEDLDCTESVKAKAKEFVRKYMAKFGEVYQRPVDETDNF